ncbi:MAG: enoyl-CoA hydratase/isomerase family protein [Alphaproteobacteria bacterium]
MTEPLLVEVEGKVAVLTINREHRLNALDDATLFKLEAALDELAEREVGAIVWTGAGTRAFSAGSDIKELAAQGPAARLAHTDLGQRIAERLEEHPAVVIAAIEGWCLGGGLELACAADLRVAGAGATFGLPEVRKLSALPTWGGTHRLARLIGHGRAREVLIFGRQLSAEEGLAWGLVAEVVAKGGALARAREIARGIAAEVDRDTLALAKRLMAYGADASAPVARHMEYLADRGAVASAAFDKSVKDFKGG